MVQTRSATRRNSNGSNNNQSNNQSNNLLRNHSSNSSISSNRIDSQLLNTMHLIRPSTGESASTSGGSNISSPPGYQENCHQNQENINLYILQNQGNRSDDDLPTYNESQYLLEPNIEVIHYEIPELANLQYFRSDKTTVSNYEIHYLYNYNEFYKFYKFKGIISIITIFNALLLFIFLNNDSNKSVNNNTNCGFYNENIHNSSFIFNTNYAKSMYLIAIIICIMTILCILTILNYFMHVHSIVVIKKINIIEITKKHNKIWLILQGFTFMFLLSNVLLLFNLDKDCDINYVIYINIFIKLLIFYCYNLINKDLKPYIYLTQIKNLNYNNNLESENNIIRRNDIIDEESEIDEVSEIDE